MKKAIIRPILFSVAAVIVIFTQSQCKKDKGEVTIYGIIDTVENCSVPFSVYFYPDYEVGGGDVSFLWDFGDGTSSTETNPSHIYNSTGLFQVTLAITNRDKTERKSINLDLQQTTLPVISGFELFSPSNQLFAPAQITFHNTSEHSTAFWWEFGDGDFSKKKHPTHVYASPGTYTVKLRSSCNGDTARSQTTIQVLSPPTNVVIEEVRVWLPSNYEGASLVCNITLHGWDEYESQPESSGSFPYVFYPSHQLFWFHYFDDDVLQFEIYEAGSGNSIYTFDIPMYRLKDEYYPTIYIWESGNDFEAEVKFRYSI